MNIAGSLGQSQPLSLKSDSSTMVKQALHAPIPPVLELESLQTVPQTHRSLAKSSSTCASSSIVFTEISVSQNVEYTAELNQILHSTDKNATSKLKSLCQNVASLHEDISLHLDDSSDCEDKPDEPTSTLYDILTEESPINFNSLLKKQASDKECLLNIGLLIAIRFVHFYQIGRLEDCMNSLPVLFSTISKQQSKQYHDYMLRLSTYLFKQAQFTSGNQKIPIITAQNQKHFYQPEEKTTCIYKVFSAEQMPVLEYAEKNGSSFYYPCEILFDQKFSQSNIRIQAATTIQAAYKQHRASKQAAIKIQSVFRGFKLRKEEKGNALQRQKMLVDSLNAWKKLTTNKTNQHTKLTTFTLNRHTKIKSGVIAAWKKLATDKTNQRLEAERKAYSQVKKTSPHATHSLNKESSTTSPSDMMETSLAASTQPTKQSHQKSADPVSIQSDLQATNHPPTPEFDTKIPPHATHSSNKKLSTTSPSSKLETSLTASKHPNYQDDEILEGINQMTANVRMLPNEHLTREKLACLIGLPGSESHNTFNLNTAREYYPKYALEALLSDTGLFPDLLARLALSDDYDLFNECFKLFLDYYQKYQQTSSKSDQSDSINHYFMSLDDLYYRKINASNLLKLKKLND